MPYYPCLHKIVKRDTFINNFIIDFEFVRNKSKDIMHGNVTKLSGKELEEIQRKSEDFVFKLNELTKSIIKDEKLIKVDYKEI